MRLAARMVGRDGSRQSRSVRRPVSCTMQIAVSLGRPRGRRRRACRRLISRSSVFSCSGPGGADLVVELAGGELAQPFVLGRQSVDAFLTNMYRGARADFVYTVTRDFVRSCQTRLAVRGRRHAAAPGDRAGRFRRAVSPRIGIEPGGTRPILPVRQSHAEGIDRVGFIGLDRTRLTTGANRRD
jgi:hypothetical protein